MAVDSKTKRYSLLGLLNLDGSIDEGDRLTLLDLYSGIAAALHGITELVARAVIWETTHEESVEWETTHSQAATWEMTHEEPVIWEE